MWEKWKDKLMEYEEWRKEKRSKNMLEYWNFLAERFFSEVPLSHEKEELCLDIGCGKGDYLCPMVQDKLFTGIGLDPILLSSLKILKRRVHKEELLVHLIRGVGEHLPIKNSATKSILLTATLDHVMNPDEVFKESHRALSQDGNLFILQSIARKRKKVFSNRTHLRGFTEDEFYDLLKKNNFKIEKIRLFPNRIFYDLTKPPVLRILRLLPPLSDLVGKLTHRPRITFIKAKPR